MAKNNISPLNQDLFFHNFSILLKTRRILDPCVEKMCGDLKSPEIDHKNVSQIRMVDQILVNHTDLRDNLCGQFQGSLNLM